MRGIERAFTFSLLLLSLGALWLSTGFVFRSRLFVLVITIPMVFLLVLEIVLQTKHSGEEERGGLDLKLGAGLSPDVVLRRGLIFSAWFIGFILTVWLLGFLYGGLLIVVLYMVFAARETPLAIGLMAVSIGLIVVMVRRLLHIPLPEGWLIRILGG